MSVSDLFLLGACHFKKTVINLYLKPFSETKMQKKFGEYLLPFSLQYFVFQFPSRNVV
jgi:hypothetical protein